MKDVFQNMKLDFRSNVPIYMQIVEQVQHKVAVGELKKFDQLPTVRQMATELRVNFNTVARAYRILDEARIISTQRGRGTYIWEEPDEAIMHNLRAMNLEELTRQALQKISAQGYTTEEIIAMMQKVNTEISEKNQIDEKSEDECTKNM